MNTLKLTLAMLVVFSLDVGAQTSVWSTSTVPGTPQLTSDAGSVTLGLKFYSDVPGSVMAVRFYKGSGNTGTHVGTLWSNSGTVLGQVTFSGETDSGWQQANFSSPVTIAANTPYVISYLAPKGSYADDQNYPWSNLSVAPLHISSSAPGVYAYGASPTFPTSTWVASNYWVDLVFTPLSTTPAGSPTSTSTSLWPTAPTPGTPQMTSDSSSVTLGLNFYSDVPGFVTGVRFYKGSNNTGTHVGALWSTSGTLLAQVVFSGETASGWQQMNFSSPISIAANTPYVISYLAPKGSYADDQNYSWSTLSSTPLHASGTQPGVFAYGSSSSFPAATWQFSNYWVDLAFSPASSPSSVSTYSLSGNVSGSAATLTLSGTASGVTKTDGGGNYGFSGLQNGSYTVTPSQSGYTFTPPTATVSLSNANKTGVNFTATATISVQHSVSLSWSASTSTNIVGYNVYRGTVSGGPYTRINTSLVAGTAYTDSTVVSGQTYYYVATAVDSNNNESAYSNLAAGTVPTP
jgi:hypothetical protein